jgi:hypothetical protein
LLVAHSSATTSARGSSPTFSIVISSAISRLLETIEVLTFSCSLVRVRVPAVRSPARISSAGQGSGSTCSR